MKKSLKTGWLAQFLLIYLMSGAQTELGLIPFSNKLLLNPSYAGLNNNTSVWSSLQFSAHPERNLNNTFTLTYDTWSEKMKGGVAFLFYQGLTGEFNTNATGAGFTFSKPFKTGTNRQFIPSFNFNAHIATKQWFVHIIDEMPAGEIVNPSPPGKEFFRHNLFQPRIGLLWSSSDTDLGLSASFNFHPNLTENTEFQKYTPYHIIFHITRSQRGNRKGLISQPFKTSPELIILYAENLILSRAGIRMEQVNQLLGLFSQNNFTGNIHGIGGVYGRKFQNFKFSLTAGTAWDISRQKPVFIGEISLGLIIPYIHFDKKNPWTPPKKLQ